MKGAGSSDIGLIRKKNQDTFCLRLNEDAAAAAAVVCDGMGGAKGGETAAAIAAETFMEHLTAAAWQELSPEGTAVLLRESVARANLSVFDRSRTDPALHGMGTTLVAAVVRGNGAVVANVGDSRCYCLTDGVLRRITVDHSHVQELVDRGIITPEEARIHPERNLITRAVGIRRKVLCDLFTFETGEGDRFLLCSDGLSGPLTDGEIRDILARTQTPEECCQELTRAALDRGAPDNVTVVVLDV